MYPNATFSDRQHFIDDRSTVECAKRKVDGAIQRFINAATVLGTVIATQILVNEKGKAGP
jgi:hypothetical protein